MLIDLLAAVITPIVTPGSDSVSGAVTFAGTLEAVERIFKILAYVVGAGWVYFNFFKGRTYHPRLEARLAGELVVDRSPPLLKSVVHVKNVGLSKVSVLPTGTALRVSAYDASLKGNWRHLTTVAVLERHQWIEPGEPVEEHSLTSVDPGTTAVRIELIIKSEKTMWEAVAIVMQSRGMEP